MTLNYRDWWLAGSTLWVVLATVAAPRFGITRGRAVCVLVASAVVAWLGATLHSYLFEQHGSLAILVTSPDVLLRSGHRMAGALSAAGIAAIVLMRILNIPILPGMDNGLQWAGVGIAVGRVGCFREGCCFGGVSNLPWAVRYPEGSPTYSNHLLRGLVGIADDQSCAVHPLGAYFVFAAILTAVSVAYANRRSKFVGSGTVCFVAVFGLSTWLIELLRESEGVNPVPFRLGAPAFAAAVALPTWWWAQARVTSRSQVRV